VAVLRLALVATLAACYAPDAPDCTLACAADSDCITGQSCTTDHLCAGAGITACANQETTDAGNVAGTDAGSGSGSGSGSGMMTTLTIQVQGGGGVQTNDGDFCDGTGDTMMTCMFSAPTGGSLVLTPVPHLLKQFDKWNGAPCMTQPLVCSTTATGAAMTFHANFKPGP
jgi:hypothetical protein